MSTTSITEQYQYLLRVLTALARGDCHDALWWRTDGDYAPATFFINCSDVFDWATADVVPVTPDTVEVLEAAMDDAAAATDGDATFGPLLFAARTRKTRPAATAYPCDNRLWPLLDACGPERGDDTGRRPKASLREALEAQQQRSAVDDVPPYNEAIGGQTEITEVAEGVACCTPASRAQPGGPDHCGLCGTPYATNGASDDTEGS